ncbi:HNH endonuclease [Bacillus cihuensis]|uniref:HNH endonuclease n=1 Tax=Bacillus cihuensis TaxID=1208599 RepID=UPI000410F346|nr:HNH endonuclease [Bacillus cihuensis]
MPRMKLCDCCGKMHPDTERCVCRREARRFNNQNKNPEMKKFFNSARWKKLRLKVLKRDQEVCLRCLIKYNVVVKDNLEAHHIKSRLNYPELTFEESNIITLCKSCNTHLGTNDKLDFKYEVPKDDWEPVL